MLGLSSITITCISRNLIIGFNRGRTNKKSNLHYTRGITPKLVTSCGAHLRGLAPGQCKNVVAVAIPKAVDDSVRLTGPESNPRLPTPIAMSLLSTPKISQKPIHDKVWERQSCKRADWVCFRPEPVTQKYVSPSPSPKFIFGLSSEVNLNVKLRQKHINLKFV